MNQMIYKNMHAMFMCVKGWGWWWWKQNIKRGAPCRIRR